MEQITPEPNNCWERQKALIELENKIGLAFLNKKLLDQSLTHSSYAHEKNLPDNERLEFLGDAVLKLVVSEYLYNKFPNYAEGNLTKVRAAVISDETLAKVGKQYNLGDYLQLSLNEKKSGGQKKKSNSANAVEALIGAIYLDAGLGKIRDLIIEFLREEIEIVSRAGYIRDFKSALQEYTQKQKWDLPHYRVIKESGPRHHRVFWMEVKIKGRRYGIGRGANKKESEQKAASMALRKLKNEEKGIPVHEKSSAKTEPKDKGIKGLFSRVKKRIKLA